jgi:hypothetical protein
MLLFQNLLSSAVLEFVSLSNVIWYMGKEIGTDHVMQNNAIFVLFNTKEFHKMAAPVIIKIIFF